MDQMQERLRYLLTRYASQDATAVEETELMNIFVSASHDEDLKQIMLQMMESDQQIQHLDKERWEPVLMRVLNQPKQKDGGAKLRQLIKRIAVAASVIIAVGLGTYFIFFNKTGKQQEVVVHTPQDVKAPENNRAQITLADGKIIYLDSAANGTLISQSGINVVKTADGQIKYQDVSLSLSKTELTYNTLHNPRGSKVIDITLSDGSHVWLNAGSSITYPIAFVGSDRKVTMTGEGYFEVAKHPTKKFIVDANGTTTEVLGTHFNINAYSDEAETKITLLEGSVKVSTTKQLNNSTIIKPGEQAVTINHSPFTINHSPDLNETMAWRNNKFIFNSANIKTIGRQLEKWYDVEIIYESPVTDSFSGIISRSKNASEVFAMLQQTGRMSVRIENKKVYIGK